MNEPRTMMKCGCVSQGTINGIAGCLVHDCTEAMEMPNLEGREAKCHCGKTQPSSPNLPFFEFCGEGSQSSKDQCKCGYAWIAHQPYWKVDIKVDRNWFACPRGIQTYSKE